MIAEDLKQLTTPQLLQLMDQCAADGMEYQVPDEVITQIDAQGVHILQQHSIHKISDDFVRARAMFKLLGKTEGSQLYFVDVDVSYWDLLPVWEEVDI